MIDELEKNQVRRLKHVDNTAEILRVALQLSHTI